MFQEQNQQTIKAFSKSCGQNCHPSGIDRADIKDLFWKLCDCEEGADDIVLSILSLRVPICFCLFSGIVGAGFEGIRGNDIFFDSGFRNLIEIFVKRTKRWMHSPKFTEHILYYPQRIAADYLPSGVPAGEEFVQNIGSKSAQRFADYNVLFRFNFQFEHVESSV